MTQSENEKLKNLKNILDIISSKMVLPLYLSFWLLDIIYVPELKWEFLVIRSSVIPCALIVNYLAKNVTSIRYAENLALFYIFYLAAILNLMIYIVGPNALYYNCLHLVSIGSLSFIPFCRRYFVYTVIAIYGPYYLIELNHIETSAQYVELAVNSFNVFSIILITLIIKLYHDNFHQKEAKLREELEFEIQKTKNAEQKIILARDLAVSATKAKSSFVANMSHEIRTPLTAIIGFSRLLKDSEINTHKSRNQLNIVIKNSEHLLHIVNDILDFSKIEAQQLVIEKSPFSLFEFLQDTFYLVEGNIQTKGLKFEINYHFPLPSVIETDDIRLKQILINLVGNATKFTLQGCIIIDVKYDFNNNHLILSVSDTGIGMTEEQLAHIFDSFNQADSSITKKYGGTGLGLSISKELSEKLGGNITVSSQLGRGSCFSLQIHPGKKENLNFVDRLPKNNASLDYQESPIKQKTVLGNILLVEDTIDNQVLISTYLEDMGATITIANHGKECLQLIQLKTFDLIFLDMQMPVMGGYDTLLELKNKKNTIPVVMLTGNALEEEKQRCEDVGSQGFLTKPIDVECLQSIVYQFLKHSTPDIKLKVLEENMQEKNIIPIEEHILEEYSSISIVSTMMGKSPKYDKLIFRFVDHLDNFISTIESASLKQDLDELTSEAHRLKGVGGNYGFRILTDICEKLEQSIHSQAWDLIENNITELKTVEQRIIVGTNQYKSSH